MGLTFSYYDVFFQPSIFFPFLICYCLFSYIFLLYCEVKQTFM